jgi:hypothetical protein
MELLNGVRVVNIGSKVTAMPNTTTNPQRMVTKIAIYVFRCHSQSTRPMAKNSTDVYKSMGRNAIRPLMCHLSRPW